MTPQEIEAVIYDGIRMVNAETGSDVQCTPETPLFGPDSEIDSLGLITILTATEIGLATHGHPVDLADDAAVEANPWRTVATLRDYVLALL